MDCVGPALRYAGHVPDRTSIGLVLRLGGPAACLTLTPDSELARVPARSLGRSEEVLIQGGHLEGATLDPAQVSPATHVGNQPMEKLNLGLGVLPGEDRSLYPDELDAPVLDQLVRQSHDIGETKVVGLPLPKVTGEEFRCLPWFPKADTGFGCDI